MADDRNKTRWQFRKRDVAVALIGPALVLIFLGIYLASPGQWVQGVDKDGDPTLLLYDQAGQLLPGADRGFYLAYIVEESYREYQVVEMITFGCSLLGGLLGGLAAVVLLRRALGQPPQGRGLAARFAAPAVVGMTALASVFFAGEEVNWGQTFVRWGISEMVEHDAEEAYVAQSVHNNLEGISVQSMGAVYLFAVLVGLPLLWHLRKGRGLPAALAPAVAAWPATTTVLFAQALKSTKSIYAKGLSDGTPKLDPFYMGYFEQMNEQKEMLMALALLIYLAYALARSIKPAAPDHGVPGQAPPTNA